jgi:hypothetical protein
MSEAEALLYGNISSKQKRINNVEITQLYQVKSLGCRLNVWTSIRTKKVLKREYQSWSQRKAANSDKLK